MLYKTSYRLFGVTLLALVVWSSGSAGPVNGQEAQPEASGKVYVAFRMEAWKTKHLNDAAQAKTYVDTLKKLGCEVRTAQHNGHTDVTCRTFFWKSLELDSHDQAHQWIDWFQQSGFETIHGHPVGQATTNTDDGKQPELVQFRLLDWQSRHIHKPEELGQLTSLCRGLGCEVRTSSHGNHTDVKIRCPEWREVELPSHAAAESWQKFLTDLGFEAKHQH